MAKGYRYEVFESIENFEHRFSSTVRPGCILIGLSIHDVNVISFLKQHFHQANAIPVIILTEQVNIPIEIATLATSSLMLLAEPYELNKLMEMIDSALELDRWCLDNHRKVEHFRDCTRQLSKRQEVIMQLILAGEPNKVIAAGLSISERTVETERAEIMRIFSVKNAVNLAVLIAESRTTLDLLEGGVVRHFHSAEDSIAPGPQVLDVMLAKSKLPTDTSSLG
jgi:FixJ family two-component response regulator